MESLTANDVFELFNTTIQSLNEEIDDNNTIDDRTIQDSEEKFEECKMFLRYYNQKKGLNADQVKFKDFINNLLIMIKLVYDNDDSTTEVVKYMQENGDLKLIEI